MDVNSVGSVPRSVPLSPTRTPPAKDGLPASSLTSPQDEVEISLVARMFDELSQSSQVRTERLAQIKAQIEAGTYDTPEKLEMALQRMLAEISSEQSE